MKTKKMIVFVCAFFLAQLSFGQITLEHTYSHIINGITRLPTDIAVIKYYSNNLETKTITIYNLDHSIYKTIELDIPDGVSFRSATCFYTGIINSDPLIEFSYSTKYKDDQNNEIEDTYIINENGDLIKKFENASIMSFYYTENGNKLWVYKTNGNEEIYSLPTTLSNVPSIQVENIRYPYPNPTDQQITIPYQLSGKKGTLSIYNATGQLTEQKKIDGNFNDLLLDVSNYSKGMYYYQIEKQKGEFMVK